MPPNIAQVRLINVASAVINFAGLDSFAVESIDIRFDKAIVWISPPAKGSALRACGEEVARTTYGLITYVTRAIHNLELSTVLCWRDTYVRVGRAA